MMAMLSAADMIAYSSERAGRGGPETVGSFVRDILDVECQGAVERI